MTIVLPILTTSIPIEHIVKNTAIIRKLTLRVVTKYGGTPAEIVSGYFCFGTFPKTNSSAEGRIFGRCRCVFPDPAVQIDVFPAPVSPLQICG